MKIQQRRDDICDIYIFYLLASLSSRLPISRNENNEQWDIVETQRVDRVDRKKNKEDKGDVISLISFFVFLSKRVQ